MTLFPDEGYLFTQSSFLIHEGASDGSITVIDPDEERSDENIDPLKKINDLTMPISSDYK